MPLASFTGVMTISAQKHAAVLGHPQTMIFGSAFTQRLGQFLRRTAGLGVLGRKEGREMPPHDLAVM